MKVQINGQERELSEGITIGELLRQRGVDPRIVVVEYNYEILPKEQYESVIIKEGDNLEIVQMVAGG